MLTSLQQKNAQQLAANAQIQQDRDEDEKRTRNMTGAATLGTPATQTQQQTMGSTSKPGPISGTRRKVVERTVDTPEARGMSGSDRM